jgi:hypothetical protein
MGILTFFKKGGKDFLQDDELFWFTTNEVEKQFFQGLQARSTLEEEWHDFIQACE